ncbi:hypothetical protein VTN77DRAFT_1034 [Rasamsonia byssochlamydoides]|uniref:uncharacterized protein n=1 Tax=Rasamsonia byssochlamydoides TaxID=89139 RepID=UPI003744AFD1
MDHFQIRWSCFSSHGCGCWPACRQVRSSKAYLQTMELPSDDMISLTGVFIYDSIIVADLMGYGYSHDEMRIEINSFRLSFDICSLLARVHSLTTNSRSVTKQMS